MKINIENAQIIEITEYRLTSDFWKKHLLLLYNGRNYLVEFYNTQYKLLEGLKKKDYVDIEFEIIMGEWEVKKWVKKQFTFLRGIEIKKTNRSGAIEKKSALKADDSEWKTTFSFDDETHEILNKIIVGSLEKLNKRITQQDAIRLAIETFSQNRALLQKSIENLSNENSFINSLETEENKKLFYPGLYKHKKFIESYRLEAEAKSKLRLRNNQVIKTLTKEYFNFMYN